MNQKTYCVAICALVAHVALNGEVPGTSATARRYNARRAAEEAAIAQQRAEDAVRRAVIDQTAAAETAALTAAQVAAQTAATAALVSYQAARAAKNNSEPASLYLQAQSVYYMGNFSPGFQAQINNAEKELNDAIAVALRESGLAAQAATAAQNATQSAVAIVAEQDAQAAAQAADQARQQAENASQVIMRADAKLKAIEDERIKELMVFYEGVLRRQYVGQQDQDDAVAKWYNDNTLEDRIDEATQAYENFLGNPIYKTSLTPLP